jgi:hypothetical protein
MKKSRLTRAGRKFLKSLKVGDFVELDLTKVPYVGDSFKQYHRCLIEVAEIKLKLEQSERFFLRLWHPDILKANGYTGTKEECCSGWVNLNWVKPPRYGQLELFEIEEVYEK